MIAYKLVTRYPNGHASVFARGQMSFDYDMKKKNEHQHGLPFFCFSQLIYARTFAINRCPKDHPLELWRVRGTHFEGSTRFRCLIGVLRPYDVYRWHMEDWWKEAPEHLIGDTPFGTVLLADVTFVEMVSSWPGNLKQ